MRLPAQHCMRKLILLLLSVAAVTIVLYGVTGLRRSALEPSESGTSDMAIRLSPLTATVWLRPQDTAAEYHTIAKEIIPQVKDSVRTSDSGRASLLYANGSITFIEPSSELIIQELNLSGTQSTLQLTIGSLFAKVNRIIDTDGSYQIKTPNLVASVRGTTLALSYLNNTSALYTLNGVVAVAVRNPDTGEIRTDSYVKLKAGEKILLSDAQARNPETQLHIQIMTSDDFKLPFIQRYFDKDGQKTILPLINPPSSSTPTPKPTYSPQPSQIPTLTPGLTSEPIISRTSTPTPRPSPNTSTTSAPTPIYSRLDSVQPSKIIFNDSEQPAKIALYGQGLPRAVQVEIGTQPVEFSVVNDTVLAVIVPAIFREDYYDIHISIINGQRLSLYRALHIIWQQKQVDLPQEEPISRPYQSY